MYKLSPNRSLFVCSQLGFVFKAIWGKKRIIIIDLKYWSEFLQVVIQLIKREPRRRCFLAISRRSVFLCCVCEGIHTHTYAGYIYQIIHSVNILGSISRVLYINIYYSVSSLG